MIIHDRLKQLNAEKMVTEREHMIKSTLTPVVKLRDRFSIHESLEYFWATMQGFLIMAAWAYRQFITTLRMWCTQEDEFEELTKDTKQYIHTLFDEAERQGIGDGRLKRAQTILQEKKRDQK